MTFQRGTQWGLDSEPDNWLLRAACRGHDPEWWTLASRSDKRGMEHNEWAVRICLGCPVRQRCLDYGMSTGSRGVIFGGQRLDSPPPARKCDVCGREYEPVIAFQRYCGNRCSEVARKQVMKQYRQRTRGKR